MSFYKEEKRGEADNFISLLAASQGQDKIAILETLAKDTATSNNSIKLALGGDSGALKSWLDFVAGYIYFHTSNPRYKLDDLRLQPMH